jgi:hypothetical protein
VCHQRGQTDYCSSARWSNAFPWLWEPSSVATGLHTTFSL